MKKKIILFSAIGIAVVSIIIGIIVLVNPPKKLDQPVVSLQDNIAQWEHVENAEKYEINIDGTLYFLDSKISCYELKNEQTFSIRAISGNKKYIDSDWSNIVKYEKTETYTVIWKNGDVILEIDKNLELGTIPSYDGETPTKDDTVQYSYEFKGWSSEIVPVSSNVTYNAVFTESIKYYSVIWKNEDVVLQFDENVAYGDLPVYIENEPIKERDSEYIYEFNGWSPAISPVTDNIEYLAQFSKTQRYYTVTFFAEDGVTILQQLKIEYDGEAIYTQPIPVKNPTESHTYLFDNWVIAPGSSEKANLNKIRSDIEVYPSFISQNRLFDVYITTNESDFGYLSSTVVHNVPYGSIIEVQNNNVIINGITITANCKQSNSQYTYNFEGWNTPLTVGHNTIIVANFNRTEMKYDVVWKNYDDCILEIDEDVLYGMVPTYNGDIPKKESDGEHVYQFCGWSPFVSAVESNIEYIAMFEIVEDEHVITFYDDDGITILGVDIVKTGENAIYSGEVPQKQSTEKFVFSFKTWVLAVNGNENADLTNIQSSIKVYAKYSSKIRQYTVKFIDYIDNTVYFEQEVEYNSIVNLPNNPNKYGYRFDGWYSNLEYTEKFVKETAIVKNTTVYAKWVKQVTVKFVDFDDSIIDLQLIDLGDSAKEPETPNRYKYVFLCWDSTFNKVYDDLVVKAIYKRQYEVKFIDYNGDLISSMLVLEGEGAVAPQNPTREGYTFKKWNNSFNSVFSDLIISAVYDINRYTVSFVYPDGSLIENIYNVAHGTKVNVPEVKQVFFDWNVGKGYYFTNWINWDEDQVITQDLIIYADYSTLIEETIIAVESVKNNSSNIVQIRVYLCGDYADLQAVSLKLKYKDGLILNENLITINTVFDDYESVVNSSQNTFEFSGINTEGIVVKNQLQIVSLTFNVENSINSKVEIIDGTYVIYGDLLKVIPIFVDGEIINE